VSRKGVGGRPPKPAKDHIEDGTYRKDRHGSRTELHVDPARLKCPFPKATEEYAAWMRIVTTLPAEHITHLDFDKLKVYCDAWGQYCRVWPQFVADPLDKDIRITALALADKVIVLGKEFGTSPLARMTLKMPAEEKEEQDPLVELINRKKDRS